MLTIRSFRNEDPPRILALWKKMQHQRETSLPMIPLSLNLLQMQVLGLPMLDARSIMLAFDGNTPVGYVHTTFAPDHEGYSFDYTTGQICFLGVDPQYHDVSGAATALIRAGEDYLVGQGARKIFGGSPVPSAPFYTGFYSGGEALGFLHADGAIINAFHEAGYQIHQKTTWFHFNLQGYTPVMSVESISYCSELVIEIHETPDAKTWWDGCTQANGVWFDTTAYQVRTNRPIARLRTRIAHPDTENVLMMYGENWLASLIGLRVHPDITDAGVVVYLLGELLRYLVTQNQIAYVEAHIAEDSPLFTLLHRQGWLERDTGCVFVKTIDGK
jgi:ribosomal protein S18 acetylase RimI-like enzyme